MALDGETTPPVEAGLNANGSDGERGIMPTPDAAEPVVQSE
jgi:hypothetical protein